MDLTKITTPFGLLDDETQNALRVHGGPYEVFQTNGAWGVCISPWWGTTNTYRVKPRPLTKPSIDWSQVTQEWRWLVRDIDGSMYLYKVEPKKRYRGWVFDAGNTIYCGHFVSCCPGTCDWRDSLVERPK